MYNAGNGNQYTLNRVWKLLQEMEGVDLPAKQAPSRAGDVRHSKADTAAAIRDLGHSPRVTIEEGLRRTLEWYRLAT
jgi:nucleoside-diphosphate-sugar epimerase